jgi:hypothetical protein
MKQKIKIIRLSPAKTFPATHSRRGEKTYFAEKIISAIGKMCNDCLKRNHRRLFT